MTASRRLRLMWAAGATVAAGLAVHFLVRGPIGDLGGDALYAVLVYLVVGLILPRTRSATVGLLALGVCAAVELVQLTNVPADLAEAFPPAALILGTGFSPVDLIAYAVGAGLAALVDSRARRP